MDCETCKDKRKVIAQTPKMEYDKVWKIISELMETLQVINPRLYAGVIKAKGITKKRAAPFKRCCPFIFPLQRKNIYNFFRIFKK